MWPVPVATSTGVSWAAADELLVWEGDFGSLGAAFEMETPHAVSAASVGTAACRLIDMRKVVRFAGGWFLDNRDLRGWLAPPGWMSVRDAADPLPVPPLSGCPATNEGRQ
jgi:aminoglycoside 3-N-acetyltransferase